MIENKEKLFVTPATLYRIEASLVLPGEADLSPREKANVLIEDAIAKRTIAKAIKLLEEKLGIKEI